MAIPFFNGASKKRDQITAIDLGGRTTKAVVVQRKSDGYGLLRYALVDAPVYEKGLSAELVGEHLKSVCAALESGTRHVSLAIGVTDSILRQAEMPLIPVPDMRQILKNNSKNYLQQDFPGFVYDCHVHASKPGVGPAVPSVGGTQKLKVLAGGAKRQLVEDLQRVSRNASLVAEYLVPGLVGPVNAFELAMPDVFGREVVALVDIGFHNTSISVLQAGELLLSRVVAIGGDKLTTGLSEAMGVSYAEAEGIKLGMPQEVQSHIEAMVQPLGRELRASLDFYEHQQDRVVTQIFVSGGSARSDLIVQLLQNELLVPCKSWNPAGTMRLGLPPQQMAEIEHVAPQLAVAIGAAISALS